MEKQKKIIYIAGYGRSGSTLLERILSSNQKIFGLGELKDLTRNKAIEDSYCSCGSKVINCSFWSDVIQDINNEFKISKFRNLQDKIESVTNLLGFIYRCFFSYKSFYERFNDRLFESIFNNISEEVGYVIDSSKTARKSFFRPIMLSKIASLDVKVVHLVRDGRGCMNSTLKGSNRKMEQGLDPHIPFAALRTAINWPLANTSAHIFQRVSSKNNYCRIKYENFVDDPKHTLNKLGVFFNIDFTRQIEMLENQENIPLGHQLAGNRLRKKEKIILKKDEKWKQKLSLRYRLLFWFLDWPWALLYKYNKS